MKLNQILAIRTDTRGKSAGTRKQLTEIHRTKADAFHGMVRSYEPLNDGDAGKPGESVRVQVTVEDAIRAIRELTSDHWGIELTTDIGNQGATANVVVNGTVLMEEVPSVHLLFLETQLVDLRTLINGFPELDPSENWTRDDALNLWKSDAVVRESTTKEERPIVLYEATERHPAQCQLITKDVVVGNWTQTKHSGAIRREDKRLILERLEAVARAVSMARQEANSAEVTRHQGNALVDFVFQG